MKWFKRRYQQQIIKGKRIFLVLLIFGLIFLLGLMIPKLKQDPKSVKDNRQDHPLAISVYLSYTEPTLQSNLPPLSQLDSYVSSISAEKYNLMPSGELLPGTDESSINLIFSEKPPQQKLRQVFILTTSISYALPVSKGYLLKDNYYFAGSNLPNIIIPLDLSAEEISTTLQAIPSLAKIKEDKVNPAKLKLPSKEEYETALKNLVSILPPYEQVKEEVLEIIKKIEK